MKEALAILAVLALLPSASLAQDKRPADQSRTASLSGFHLVLLIGEDKENPGLGNTTPSGEGLTPAIIKALQDVQQFLPFKSYRVWDSTFIRGEMGSTSVKAPGNEIYVANINGSRQRDDGRYSVRLTLSPTEPAPITKDAPRPRSVLDTMFQMDVGETIVAGTSRQPRSGTALVMVVTALPASALRH
jgi:hypothetical protein